MKFVSVRELRNKAAGVWGDLKKEREIVLTSNGRPIAIITSVTGESLENEIKAVRRARALLALERVHEAAREKGLETMSMSDVDDVIGEARRERGRKKVKAGK